MRDIFEAAKKMREGKGWTWEIGLDGKEEGR